jgi:hypothetical protein
VTLARPRKHSVHPADLHVLLNTLSAPSVTRGGATASWLPLCLPKFDSAGFVNAYVHFLEPPAEPAPADAGADEGTEEPGLDDDDDQQGAPGHGIAFVCVSAGADFDAIRAWGDSVAEVRPPVRGRTLD